VLMSLREKLLSLQVNANSICSTMKSMSSSVRMMSSLLPTTAPFLLCFCHSSLKQPQPPQS
jgi:hypothetical protein